MKVPPLLRCLLIEEASSAPKLKEIVEGLRKSTGTINVTTVNTFPEAVIELMRQGELRQQFDFLIVEVAVEGDNKPPTNYGDVIRSLKLFGHGVRVIVLTRISSLEGVRQACLDAGADYFFGKPFREGELTSAILKVVEY